jgi:hypothetical protein
MDSSSADPSQQFDGIDSASEPKKWLDLIDHVTGELAENDESIQCELDDITVDVPMQMRPDANTARWKLDGGLTVSFGEVSVPLREWREYWDNAE